VCLDCGLVVERLYGGGGGGAAGGQILRGGGGGGDLSRPPPLDDEEYRARRTARERVAVLVTRYLTPFGLDNEVTIELVLANYARIYGERRTVQKSDFKERVAIAFSVCNVMARQHTPRPPQYVARLCDVPVRSVLAVCSSLSIGPEERRRLRREDYELEETAPEDYVDVVCAHLGVPFKTATDVRSVAERARWILHGRHPTVIAAAAARLVFEQEALDERLTGSFCELLDCSERTVQHAVDRLYPRILGCPRPRRRRRQQHGETAGRRRRGSGAEGPAHGGSHGAGGAGGVGSARRWRGERQQQQQQRREQREQAREPDGRDAQADAEDPAQDARPAALALPDEGRAVGAGRAEEPAALQASRGAPARGGPYGEVLRAIAEVFETCRRREPEAAAEAVHR
jgi:hypothetical protein